MALQLYVSGQGYNAAEIAAKLGAAPVTVKKVFAVYRASGLQALLQAPHEGRPKGVPKAVSRETLETVKQELSQPDAPFRSYGDVQKRFEELEGKPVACSSAHHIARYTLKAKLKRPRPSNVQKNAGREEAIKKIGLLTRLVLGWLVSELDVRRLAGAELWNQDEMRMGLRTDLGRKITAQGVKPVGRYRHVYRYIYLYGAVNLSTGEHEFMEADAVNTTFFEAFLRQIANVNPMLLKVVLLDNASYHKAKRLKIPNNILLIFLSPYTPELNPIERFWQEVRRPFKGRIFASLDELKQAVVDFLCALDSRHVRQTVAFPILLIKYQNKYTKLNYVLL